MAWPDAEAKCVEWGGNLASITLSRVKRSTSSLSNDRRISVADMGEEHICELVTTRYPKYQVCYEEEQVLGVPIT